MGNAIFISYRRDDSEGEAGRLFDDLTRAFGNESVFMDVAGIRPGADFRHVIDDSVAHCGVLLSIIGPNWAGITNADGKRRLEDPNDFVVLETASALKRKVPVIPVLVHGAKMPTPDQLPESLKDLCYHNSVEISHTRWNSDVQLLIQALGSYVTTNPKTEQDPIHATVPVQLPAPHTAHAAETPAVKKSKLPLILGLGAVGLVVIIVAIVLLSGPGSSPAAAPSAGGAPAAGTVAAAAPAASAAGPPAGLSGDWIDQNPREGNSLYALTISSGPGNQLLIHAFGACQPNPCDWGTQTATFDGVDEIASFTLPDSSGEARSAKLKVHLKDGVNLDVDVHNTFTDSSGTRENKAKRTFVSSHF